MSRGPVRCTVCALSSDNTQNLHHPSYDLMTGNDQARWHRSITFAQDEGLDDSIVCSDCYEHLAEARQLWDSYEEEEDDY